MKKYEKISDEFFKLSIELSQECTKYLTKILKKRKDHKIKFTGLKDCSYTPTVVYDGGNHPEYASNAFSTVWSVYLDINDDICFETEDTPDYPIDYITTEELYDICSFIDEHKL